MASDPELAADHLRAQALQAKFNATAADAEEERAPFWCNCSAVFKSALTSKPEFSLTSNTTMPTQPPCISTEPAETILAKLRRIPHLPSESMH